jgi:hypothetical protein
VDVSFNVLFWCHLYSWSEFLHLGSESKAKVWPTPYCFDTRPELFSILLVLWDLSPKFCLPHSPYNQEQLELLLSFSTAAFYCALGILHHAYKVKKLEREFKRFNPQIWV